MIALQTDRVNRPRRGERPGGRCFLHRGFLIQRGRERRRRLPADPAVRPAVVLRQTPRIQHGPRLGQAEEQFPVQELISQPAVERLHVPALPRARLLDVQRTYRGPTQPAPNLLRHEFRAVVATNARRRPAQRELVLQESPGTRYPFLLPSSGTSRLPLGACLTAHRDAVCLQRVPVDKNQRTRAAI
jgi:hypothetical protein